MCSAQWLGLKEHLKSTIDQAIKNYLPDAERASGSVQSTDTLTTNLIVVSTASVEYDALSSYFGDVYDFENAIPDLADVIMKIAPKYVGYKIEDLMWDINKNVFSKQRLIQGYKAVYEAAFEYLVETERMELAGDLIQAVQENHWKNEKRDFKIQIVRIVGLWYNELKLPHSILISWNLGGTQHDSESWTIDFRN